MTAPGSALDEAIGREAYEAAALRLLLGALIALDEAAPRTREAFISLMTPERR